MKPTYHLNLQQFQHEYQSKNNDTNTFSFTLKTIIILPIIIAFLFYRILYQNNVQFCYIDIIHQITHPINRWMANGSWPVIIGIGQILTDGAVLSMIIFWILFPKNIRLPSTTAVFFSIRAIFLNIQKFPFPDHIVWKSPGIFSGSVPYDHTRDFFYSGHTGTILTLFLQMYNCNLIIPSILSGLSSLYVISMLLVCRIHYAIDIFGAVLYIIYFNQFVKKYLFYFDYFWSLPYTGIKWACQHFKKKNFSLEKETSLMDQ